MKNSSRQAQTPRRDPIAIVGIGCRYPGTTTSPEEFWQFILDKRDGFKDIPADRWNLERFHDSGDGIEGTAKPRQGAFLEKEDIRGFDAPFFNFSPREAECIDPQQRLLLQVAWESLEDANIPPTRWSGQQIGVYMGGFTIDNYLLQCSSENYLKIDQSSATSSTLVMLSNRLSYFFDFKGPSFTIDTACSSSLVAFNYACQDLWNNKTEAALVGGVNAMLFPSLTVTMSKGGFLSPDSRSKTFDALANGYARGEGAGVVVLKPLSKAIEDGDRIYATIASTGVNQDGRSAGIASPNGESQGNLIKTVLDDGNINPDDIVLVEAHGTGTAVGDPTEINALGDALGPRNDTQSRYISSIKGNIGHQEAGAGVAGVIKTALSLYHDTVPPQASLNEVNPALELDFGSFDIPRQPERLVQQDAPKLACINSFGYGGTNAHAILGQYTPKTQAVEEEKSNKDTLFIFSAKSPGALHQIIRNTAQAFVKDPALNRHNVAHSLACGRDRLDYQFTLPVPADEDPLDLLNTCLAQINDGVLTITEPSPSPQRGPVFLYTGMGPQWWAMGRELYGKFDAFKQAVDEADIAFSKHAGWSIKEAMMEVTEDLSQMRRNKIAQPANFVLQHGLTSLLESWGIKPASVIGHSVGEVSAALAAGCLNVEQAAEVAYHRSRLQQTKAGQGRMLATGLDLETAQSIVDLYEGELSIGAINSPSSIAIAGSEDTLRQVMSELDDQGIFNKLIFGEVAYHSHQMADLEDELMASLKGLVPAAPKVPLYSTAYGRKIETAEHDAAFWWANVRQPVLFEEAIHIMADAGYDQFIEVGPHPVLAGSLSQIFAARDGSTKPTTYGSLSRGKPEHIQLLNLASRLWEKGLLHDWSLLLPGQKIRLATYPWQNETLWRESPESRTFREDSKIQPILGRKVSDTPDIWENVFDSRTLAFLKDHIIDEKAIFPGAGYVEAFIGACNDLFPNQRFGLGHIQFEKMLPLPADGSVQTRVVAQDNGLAFYARELKQDQPWQLYARCDIIEQSRSIPGAASAMTWLSDGQTFDGESAYEALDNMGLNYAHNFQPLTKAVICGQKVQGHLKIVEEGWSDERLSAHPALIDGALQLLALSVLDHDSPPVPVQIKQLDILSDTFSDEVFVEGELFDNNTAFLRFMNASGEIMIELHGVEMQHIPSQNAQANESLLYQYEWADFAPDSDDDAGKSPVTISAIKGTPAVSIHIETVTPVENQRQVQLFLSQSTNDLNVNEAEDFINSINQVEESTPEETIVLLTQGAWSLNATDVVHPAQSALCGIARSVRHEKPKQPILSLDLDASFNDWVNLPSLIGDLPDFGEFALREGQLKQHRLVKLTDPESSFDPMVSAQDNISAVLQSAGRGGFAGLHYQGEWRREPNDDEIEIKIEYSSINFKDVLKVLSRLTDQTLKGTFFQKSLGMEASAVVTKAGQNTDFTVGERVVLGHKEGTFQTYQTLKPEDAFILRWGDLPLSTEELATLPIGYISSFYGLKKVADLGPDDTVLLHSASGGVGHACIHIAQDTGAKIIATSGTEEKRQYLRDLGIEHVFDSRSLDFEGDVLNVTGGEGVDVVLNFLPGALMHANLRILKPFGHLIELGKADIGANKGLPLAEFERNLSFTAIDIDHMLRFRRDLFNRTAADLKQHLVSGAYKPLPTIVSSAADPISAFKHMAEGNHIGKCMMDFTQPINSVKFPSPNLPLFDDKATYLVTGGTKGFGLACAKWLAEKGVAHLVLMARSEPDDGSLDVLRDGLQAKGGSLKVFCGDVGNRADVQSCFESIAKTDYPLGAIFHAAAVLRDAPMSDLSRDDITQSFHAKAHGAKHLHDLCVETGVSLKHFVLFSSISGMVGNAAQANYAAANAYLDALAAQRRSQGLPATSIAWGSIGEVGMVARDETVSKYLESKGITPLPLNQAFMLLEDVLTRGLGHVGCFDVDWDKWHKRMQNVSAFDPISSLLTAQDDSGANANLSALLKAASEDAYEEITCDFLLNNLAEVLNIKKELLTVDKPITLLGIDSLMSIEFQLAIETNLGCSGIALMPDIQKTVREIAQDLVELLVNSEAFNADELDEEVDIDSLSDEEVEAMLAEMSEEKKAS